MIFGIILLKILVMKNVRNNIAKNDNTVKNPDEWKTGNEPMTGAQKSYVNTLASEAGENVDQEMTKAEAAKKIDELQEKTGRGG